MQPDSIFKEKLESIRMTAPESAWSKIEAGLTPKKNKFPLLKIAASVGAVALVLYVGWPQQPNDLAITQQTPTEAARDNRQPTTENNSSKNDLIESPLELAEVHTKESTVKNEIREKLSLDNKKSQSNVSLSRKEFPDNKTKNTTPALASLSSLEDETNTREKIESTTSTIDGFKMVVSVNQVNDLYLKKKSSDQATAENQKTSGIKRLIEKAHDLKNNQDPIGDLRIIKNELFAFNHPLNKNHESEKQINYE